MLNSYLLVERSALPDYFIKVVEARRLLDSGVYSQVRALAFKRSGLRDRIPAQNS